MTGEGFAVGMGWGWGEAVRGNWQILGFAVCMVIKCCPRVTV